MLSAQKHIRRSFSNAASSYNLAASHQKVVAEKLLEYYQYFYYDEYAKHCVVDIGSGTGFVANEIFRHTLFESIISLDISEAMLHQDNQFQSVKNKICADLQVLPFQHETIDLCLSSYAFQWAGNVEKLFQELYRVLKPGGMLFFSIPGPSTFSELKQAWADVDDKRHINDQHVNNFLNDKTILQFAFDCGFKALHYSQQDDVLAYSEQKHALQHIKNIGASNINQQRRKGLLGKQQYADFSKAFRKYSSPLANYTLSYESYFFGFLKPYTENQHG